MGTTEFIRTVVPFLVAVSVRLAVSEVPYRIPFSSPPALIRVDAIPIFSG